MRYPFSFATITLLLICLPPGRADAAVPIPLPGTAPIDVAQIRVNNPAVLSTNGSWRFKLTHGAMIGGAFVEGGASASSSEKPAADAIDGDPATRWCASNASMPQWWQVDLREAQQIQGIRLAWEFGDGRYCFRVEGSTDDQHWSQVFDHSAAPGAGDGSIPMEPTTARYIRITVTDAADAHGEKKWASIRDVAITVERDGKPVIWTSGPTGTESKEKDSFASADLDDRGWSDLSVPSNWEVAGLSIPTYGNADNAVGLYRRWMDIPADFAGKKILWHFDGVTDSAEIFLNGKRIGYHEGGFTAFDIDLTAAIKPGAKNLLAVRVCKSTPTVDLDTGDYWLLGGIHRESYLLVLPQDHIDDLTLVTDLDAKYTDATLKTDVLVKGAAGDHISLSAGLYAKDGTKLDLPPIEATGVIAADGSINLHLQSNVKAPRLWSAEKPNLYYLVLSLRKNDQVVETAQQRFGFRQVEIKDGVLLWNGVAIKCTGTCRHEEWSAVGHALTEQQWQTDVAMMKAANINAVRTSHYNHAQRFLELCEEKGLYVLDEIPACWVDPKNAALKPAFLQHAAETFARDKNLACVLAWSCGNESGWGPNFKAMADYVAATDPTRPRFVSCIEKTTDPILSFNDHHYPQDASLNRIANTPGPSVITEGPHIFYVKPGQIYDYGVNDFWGQALAATWNRVWPSKSIFGAFIWEWQDQGLADKFPDQSHVDAEGLRSNNHKGIVTGYRVPKPEYYHVKMVYSPVAIAACEIQPDGDKLDVEVQNRYAFTDLSELTCQWQVLQEDKPLANGELRVNCPPGATATAQFPLTSGMDTLRLEFIHPDGRSIYSTRLHVAGMPLPAPPADLAAGESFKCETTERSARLSNSIAHLDVDKTTGVISLYRGAEAKPLLTGPILNLGEAREDDGDFLNRSDPPWIGSSAPPILSNVKVVAGLIGPDNSVGQITVTSEVKLTESPDVIAKLTYRMRVHRDWQLDVNYDLLWNSPDAQAWELGVKFRLPKSSDVLSWYRQGQWTEYPPDHIGAAIGTAKSTDVSFRCTKRDVIWAQLSGLGLLAGKSPLHVRANAEPDATVVFASSAVSPPRDFSWNYLSQYKILLKQGQTYHGDFAVRLTPDGDPIAKKN